ncbi:MAG: DUF429 domain-containing protein [Planctomycetia bacterium]|nr:DUF429 domain-containing protein [Planctomycetia bacterium]
MGEYSLGLDWISSSEGWAVAAISQRNGSLNISLVRIPAQGESSPIIKSATRIILDAPIGLPTDSEEGCRLRPCDEGARKWIGPALRSSVFAVPYEPELIEWQRRREGQQKQRLGHFRGLLPAIYSATQILNHHGQVLESHPELCFAALAGKQLPSSASKKTLLGTLARLAILRRHAIDIPLEQIEAQGRVPTDNFIDAVSMALIAHAWARNEDLSVITNTEGKPISWHGKSKPTTSLMVLPANYLDTRTTGSFTPAEIVALADEWNG